MSRKGENIYKRKDGRWEGRFIKRYETTGKAKYGYVYAKSYKEVKSKLEVAKINSSQFNDTNDETYGELLDKWLDYKKRCHLFYQEPSRLHQDLISYRSANPFGRSLR